MYPIDRLMHIMESHVDFDVHECSIKWNDPVTEYTVLVKATDKTTVTCNLHVTTVQLSMTRPKHL